MAGLPFPRGGIYGAVMDPRTRAAGRFEMLSGMGGGGVPDISSAFQLGEQYGAEEEEQYADAGGGMGGGMPAMQGDSTGVSDLHPMLIEMTRRAMAEGDSPTSEDKGLALAQAGFGMAAGQSPHALQNIGAGAMQGVQALQELRQQRALQRMKEVQAAAMMARAVQPRQGAVSALGRAQQERAQLAEQFGEADPRVKQYDDWIAKQVSQAGGAGDPVFKQQIAALRAANPSMSEQEATNAVLLDRERLKDARPSGIIRLPTGEEVRTYFDPQMGKDVYYDAQGTKKAIPFGVQNITPGEGAALPRGPFEKKELEFLDVTESLRKKDEYLGAVESAEQGWKLAADNLMASVKTFFDSGQLTPQELATREGQAKLQGLIGASRLAMLGPGPVTEYDAARIVQGVGGDVNAWQNKEVVAKVLGDLYDQDKRRAEMMSGQLMFSAPSFGISEEVAKRKYALPEAKNFGKSAGSGSDGGAAGAGSGKRRIRIGADGKVMP